MRPIADPDALEAGATLYHSAFGFARVEATDSDAVRLAWERPGAHLPQRVRHENLKRVYALCSAEGFFHRALHDHGALLDALRERPADALVWLLDDLAGPQRLRDVMDWLVGRELFTPKTFVRWWATAEGVVRADARLTLDGEWLHRTDDDTPPPSTSPLSQLDRASGAPTEGDGWDLASLLEDDATDTSEVVAMDDPVTAEVFLPMDPVPLADARPPAGAWPVVGHAMARALAERIREGRPTRPSADAAVLHPDGTVAFDETAPDEALLPAQAVHMAAVALTEAFLGRAVPPGIDPARLVPHLRHLLPDLPPSATAPLLAALHPERDQRPSPSAWQRMWSRIETVERARTEVARESAVLRAGYDSHVGRVKLMLTQTNQDAFYVGARGSEMLAVVADGISLSDAGSGDMASRIAVHTIARIWSQLPADRVPSSRLIDRALAMANTAVCEAALEAAGGDLTGRMPMGTTVVVVHARGNRLHLAWLGDSRAYVVGPWGAGLLTADDNVSGESFGRWCSGTARAWHPDGHALVRYLGHFDDRDAPSAFRPHHASLVLRRDERLVILTDGITDYIAHDEASLAARIAATASEGTVDEACRALVGLANAAGGGDNATAVILEHVDV